MQPSQLFDIWDTCNIVNCRISNTEDVCRYSAPQIYDRLNIILLLERTETQRPTYLTVVSTDSKKLVMEFFTHSTEIFSLRRMSWNTRLSESPLTLHIKKLPFGFEDSDLFVELPHHPCK